MSTSVEVLLREGYQCLQKEDPAGALRRYERVIIELPSQPVGYIGRAIALLLRPEGCSNEDLARQILQTRGKPCDPAYREALCQLLELPLLDIGATLFSFACNSFRYDMVCALVDLGTNIHAVSKVGTTGLWFVCRKPLPADRVADGRKIARMLIDMGAQLDVTNTGGVKLYNESTDPEIAKMILAVAPQLQKGGKPAGLEGSKKEGASLSFVLALVGVGLGIALGSVLEQFFSWLLWAVILGVLGGFFGSQIDRIREGIEHPGKAIRNIVIGVALLAGLIWITVSTTLANQPNFGYCYNCGSKMETKYIYDGGCSRCNGTKWH